MKTRRRADISVEKEIKLSDYIANIYKTREYDLQARTGALPSSTPNCYTLFPVPWALPALEESTSQHQHERNAQSDGPHGSILRFRISMDFYPFSFTCSSRSVASEQGYGGRGWNDIEYERRR